MRTRIAIALVSATAVAVALSAPAVSQEAKPEPAGTKGKYRIDFASPEEMMERWQAARTPGLFHERLGYFLGEWETHQRLWMGGEGSSPPMESKGTAVYRWKIEGLWLELETRGTMMGMSVVGYGFLGYDNFKKKYVSCWIDNMNSHLLTMDGSVDPTGKTFLQYGLMDEPSTGEVGKNVKYITRIIDHNTHVFEIHDMAIGEKNAKVVEVTYKRKSK